MSALWTVLSAIRNHFHPEYGCDDFLCIIDWMPCILGAKSDGPVFLSPRGLAHVEKPFAK